MTSSELADIKYEKLRRFNLIMGLFHFIQAVIMLVIANYDVQMTFTTSFIDASGGFPPHGSRYTCTILQCAVGTYGGSIPVDVSLSSSLRSYYRI